MIIYKHNHKDRIVMELDENQFAVISHLLEKSSSELSNKMDNPLAKSMSEEALRFLQEEL